MTYNLPEISSMSIKDLKAELLSYNNNLDIHSYLDKESLINSYPGNGSTLNQLFYT